MRLQWVAVVYAEYLTNAISFFHDLRDLKDVAWKKPPTLGTGLYTLYMGNHIFLFLLAVQLGSGNLFLAMFNVFNFAVNMTTISRTLNSRHIIQTYWIPFAGQRIKAKIIERSDASNAGSANTLALAEKLQWCHENVKPGNWTLYDQGFWLNADHIKKRISNLSFADFPHFLQDRDDATVDFVFRKKRDASLFKLTWGGA